MTQLEPTFNLWTEPWITLERADGALEDVGIEQALLESHCFRAIYDPSPLVVVGIHRLLAAILQDALDPQRPGDLAGLWREERFSEETIREFGAIGNGVSFAMGVAAARPERTVVLFDGDGSLLRQGLAHGPHMGGRPREAVEHQYAPPSAPRGKGQRQGGF